MKNSLFTSKNWWMHLVQCPNCNESPFTDNFNENSKCQSCGTNFQLNNNTLKWLLTKEQTKRYDHPKSKLDLIKRGLNPLSNPLLPLRYWSKFQIERYYRRTLTDRDLAIKWAKHYLSGIELPKGAAILDHGCGRGRNVGLLNQLGYQVAGQDMTENTWWNRFSNAGFQVLPPDCDKLPWKNSSFDLVNNNLVVCYLDKKKLNSFVKEIKRVLKPGGVWLILEANEQSLGHKHFQIESLTPLDLMRSLATKNGFREIDTSYEGFYAPYFPLFINFLRKQCGPWPFDVSDYDSWLAKQISPEKRGLWLLRLQREEK